MINIEKKSVPLILLVEDEPVNAVQVKDILGGECEVVITKGSDAAVAFIDSVPRVDLIFIDIGIRGTHSFETLLHIRGAEKGKDVPIVFFSSGENKSMIREGLEFGAVDYTLKPIIPEHFVGVVNHYLQGKLPHDFKERVLRLTSTAYMR